MSFREIYAALCQNVVSDGWWPAETPFEVAVGAILTQNVAWTNVEKAIARLKEANLLDPQALLSTQLTALQQVIRPAGYMVAKSRYLHNVSGWFHSRFDQCASLPTPNLRAELLGIKGIGPETADDILLYVFDRPLFIWDLYSRRMLTTCGYDVPNSYEGTRRRFNELFVADQFTSKESQHFHGLIVEGGKIARKTDTWPGLAANKS